MGLRFGMVLLAGCHAGLGDGASGTTAADAGASIDARNTATADAPGDGTQPLGVWSAPAAIPGASTAASEDDVTLSSNKLELYFKRNDAGDVNLYVMTRASATSPWDAPTALAVLNTAAQEESPRLTTDDLTLYFGRAGDIYVTTRTAIGQPWSAPTAVVALNTAAYEKWAAVCSTGYVVVSRENGTNGQDLYEGTIAGGAPTGLAQMNTSANEQGTFLTADCLGLYFQSSRAGSFDIYAATRTSTSAAWSNPTPLTDFNTINDDEEDPWLSTDQRVFAFASDKAGNKDLYLSTR